MFNCYESYDEDFYIDIWQVSKHNISFKVLTAFYVKLLCSIMKLSYAFITQNAFLCVFFNSSDKNFVSAIQTAI